MLVKRVLAIKRSYDIRICLFTTSKQQQKMKERQQKQKDLEQMMSPIGVEQQEQMNEKAIKEEIMKRKAQIYEDHEQKQISSDQLLIHTILMMPIFLQGVPIEYMLGYLDDGYSIGQINNLLKFNAKYGLMHFCFYAGIHWGICFSEDDIHKYDEQQQHFNNIHFVISSVLIAFSVGLTYMICYTDYGMKVKWCWYMGYSCLHLMVLQLDMVKKTYKAVPKWYLNLKLLVVLGTVFGNGCLAYVLSRHEDNQYLDFKEPNVYARYLQLEKDYNILEL